MGYYSVMNINVPIKIKKEDYFDFKYLVTGKRSEKWDKIAEKHGISDKGNNVDYLRYNIEEDTDCEDGFVIIEFNGNSERKNYADKLLAKIIFKFVQNTEPIEIMFRGEDGCEWGFKISQGKMWHREEIKTFKETKIKL